MDSKLRNLLEVVVNRTRGGTLSWQTFGSEAFRARIGPGNIHVQRGTIAESSTEGGSTNALRYSAQVSNAFGQVVAEAEAIEGHTDPQLPLLQSLFDAARTSGLGGYRVIEDMLQALGPAEYEVKR